jgi:hypothetical protein
MLTETEDAWDGSGRISVNTWMLSRISNMPPTRRNIFETGNFYDTTNGSPMGGGN